jgi:hypothetical protein
MAGLSLTVNTQGLEGLQTARGKLFMTLTVEKNYLQSGCKSMSLQFSYSFFESDLLYKDNFSCFKVIK